MAQYELIEASSFAPLMMQMAIASSLVIKPVAENAHKISEENNVQLFGLNETQFAELVERNERYGHSKVGMERMPSAVLLSLVATFDTLVVDILAKMLRLQTDWLEKSERTVSLAEIASAKNIDELIKKQIAEEIYHFSRGSHSEQATYIKRNFGIDIQNNWKRWPDYIEVFERRNLVAHGETTFNARYVDICKKSGHKGCDKILNGNIMLTSSYLKQSLNILVEFLALLSFSLFRKFVREKEEEAFTNLNEAAFKLIKKGRYVVAERLCAYALSLDKVKIKTDTRLMLVVNRASALRHEYKLEEAKKVLDEEDWSAVSDIFKLCVASVSGDVKKFVEMIPAIKASGSIQAHSIVTWPCFKFMLQEDEAYTAISTEFGIQPLENRRQESNKVDVADDKAVAIEGDNPPVLH